MTNRRLLLIDDNEDNRILVKFGLETISDWKVSTANNGVQGITKAEEERPDAILLDFMMSGIDGVTVYEILKSNLFTCTIPIIFITAMTHERVLTQLRATSAEGIIIKPFDLMNLPDRISKLCNWC